MNNMKKYISALLLSAIMPIMAMAQGTSPEASSASVAMPFTRISMDAHSASMAGATLTNTSSVAFASFLNPASVAFSEKKFHIGATYQMYQPSLSKSNIAALGLAMNFNKKLGVTAGFSLNASPAYDVLDQSGAVSGTFAPKDIQANVGVSYRVLKMLSVGANVKYLSSSVAEGYSYGAISSDIFAMLKLGGLKVAAGVASLGSNVKSETGASFGLPTSAKAGAGYTLSFGNNKIEAEVNADYYFYGGFAASVGGAYSFNNMLTARAGYHLSSNGILPSHASVGAGVNLAGIKLDLAYLLGSAAMNNTLLATVSFAF
jgi:hypothetical protein